MYKVFSWGTLIETEYYIIWNNETNLELLIVTFSKKYNKQQNLKRRKERT